jgi:hypothetical protein
MTDYSETAANVAFSSRADFKQGTASEAMTVGQPAVYNLSTGKWDLADASSAAGAGIGKGLVGIVAAAPAADGQPVLICTYDPEWTPGFTTAIGTQIVISDTEGNLMPDSDLSSGEYVTIMGTPISTTQANLDPEVTGVAVSA